MNLNGKRALITGGRGGIGAAIAKRLLKEGARVIVASRHERDSATALTSSSALIHDRADVNDPNSLDALFRRSVDRWEGLDIVIAAAGVMADGTVARLHPADLEAMLQTNVVGTHRTVQAAAKALRRAGGGHLLTLSSTITTIAAKGTAGYAATKAAVEAYTRTAAVELARRDNIILNCLAPGFTAAGMSTALIADDQHWPAYQERIALGRAADPDHIADVAAFLVSPLNTYMVGQTVRVDGGLTFP